MITASKANGSPGQAEEDTTMSATYAVEQDWQSVDSCLIPSGPRTRRIPVRCACQGQAHSAAARSPPPQRRLANVGVRRYSHGYKTRVLTGAICPVTDETETVASKGAPT